MDRLEEVVEKSEADRNLVVVAQAACSEHVAGFRGDTEVVGDQHIDPDPETRDETLVVVVRQVPALVCSMCGEAWIEDAVAAKLEGVVEAARGKQAAVEVTDWEQVAAADS